MASFFAKLKRTSTTHNAWRGLNKPRGEIHAIQFVYSHGEYASAELTEEEVGRLRYLNSVTLVMMSTPLPLEVVEPKVIKPSVEPKVVEPVVEPKVVEPETDVVSLKASRVVQPMTDDVPVIQLRRRARG